MEDRTNLQQMPRRSVSPSAVDQIKVALATMACYRGATVTPEYLNAFSARLAQEHLPGVLESLRRLGETPREEGETALPDLGTILKNRPIRSSWE